MKKMYRCLNEDCERIFDTEYKAKRCCSPKETYTCRRCESEYNNIDDAIDCCDPDEIEVCEKCLKEKCICAKEEIPQPFRYVIQSSISLTFRDGVKNVAKIELPELFNLMYYQMIKVTSTGLMWNNFPIFVEDSYGLFKVFMYVNGEIQPTMVKDFTTYLLAKEAFLEWLEKMKRESMECLRPWAT